MAVYTEPACLEIRSLYSRGPATKPKTIDTVRFFYLLARASRFQNNPPTTRRQRRPSFWCRRIPWTVNRGHPAHHRDDKSNVRRNEGMDGEAERTDRIERTTTRTDFSERRRWFLVTDSVSPPTQIVPPSPAARVSSVTTDRRPGLRHRQ